MALQLTATTDTFALDGEFRISRGVKDTAEVVTVTLADGTFTGRGECVPYARYGETVASVVDEVTAMQNLLADGMDRKALQQALPAGAARNALDCAFWDLEAKQTGKRIWEMLDLPAPDRLTTAFTLSLDTPLAMEAKAREHAHRPLLKLKLAGPEDLDRVRAVRSGAPDSKLIVDANEGWSLDDYLAIEPELAALGVIGVEQPLPASEDDALIGLDHSIPLIADESCHASEDYGRLRGRYDMINIKLDKTGGLTEALKLQALAEADGMPVMVGCMVGSSLAMAPAMILGMNATIIDLDGPLLLAEDRASPIRYNGSLMVAPSRHLWG